MPCCHCERIGGELADKDKYDIKVVICVDGSGI